MVRAEDQHSFPPMPLHLPTPPAVPTSEEPGLFFHIPEHGNMVYKSNMIYEQNGGDVEALLGQRIASCPVQNTSAIQSCLSQNGF